jgi:pimeloyl-ACP methyl ester carboxylesterase
LKEAAVTFGLGDGLVGIHTPSDGPTDLCCLFVNAGIIHRIGPHRVNVKMARALAASGVASLRFDLAGRGDSRAATGTASYEEQGVTDVRHAIDYASRALGYRRFLIFGICSGAVNAFRSALADERVVGIFMVDGYWYRTPWTEHVRLWRRFRALSPGAVWRALLRRLSRRSKPRGGAAPQAEIFTVEDSNNPSREQFAREMNQLIARGVDTFFLYTNSVTDLVSYAGQLAHAFRGEPFVKRMRCAQRLDIDHTMVSLDAQREIVAMVRDWASGIAVRAAGA